MNHVDSYPRDQQTSALRMALSTKMLQTVDMVLSIDAATHLCPGEILTRIHQHIRKRHSVALDRVFDECRQNVDELFDDFYIRLQRIAGCADLCVNCYGDRMRTCILTGIKDQEARKKLLAVNAFLTLQQAVDTCRAEESACSNEPMFRGGAGVNKIVSKSSKVKSGGMDRRSRQRSHSRSRDLRSSEGQCRNCGYSPHREGVECPVRKE